MIDRTVLDRLVLARYLLELGRQSLQVPAEVGLHGAAILLQDAVEAFLVGLAEHVDAPLPPRAEFDKYFVAIDAKISPKQLPFKAKLLRLKEGLNKSPRVC